MLRTGRRFLVPFRSWECNARWEYDNNNFKLSVPIYMRWEANTVPRIESWKFNESEIIFSGSLFEEPTPNKNMDIEYNGKKSGQTSW